MEGVGGSGRGQSPKGTASDLRHEIKLCARCESPPPTSFDRPTRPFTKHRGRPDSPSVMEGHINSYRSRLKAR
eukprot:scaffold262378_cov28-Tisochrysis_lutea.AAC.8